MPFRTALAILCLAIAISLSSSQFLITTAHAISPLTSPITSPITSFERIIQGKITLKQFRFFGGFVKRFAPASDITVKLVNTKTHEIKTTTTNASGMYEFMVDKGFYKVLPVFASPKPSIIAPPFRFVFVKNHDKLHVDFHAIDFL